MKKTKKVVAPENPKFVVVVWTHKLKQTYASHEDEKDVREKLRVALAKSEIDSYNLYTWDNWQRFHKRDKQPENIY